MVFATGCPVDVFVYDCRFYMDNPGWVNPWDTTNGPSAAGIGGHHFLGGGPDLWSGAAPISRVLSVIKESAGCHFCAPPPCRGGHRLGGGRQQSRKSIYGFFV